MTRPGPAGLAVLTVLAAGCGAQGGAGADRTGSPQVEGEVTVFAAASLTEAFTELAGQFERAHPDVSVTLSFAASSTLAQSVVAGAPVDVYAAASPSTMQLVVDAGAAGAPVVFARNRLQIAVPVGNPGGVDGLADLADPDRTVALCAAQVPCGAAAEQVFAAAGVTPAPDTLEQDVKAVLAKVRLDEVDAALVYVTDVRAAAGEVEGISFPASSAAVNDYPLAVLDEAPNPVAARAFAELVVSDEGRRVLSALGFDGP